MRVLGIDYGRVKIGLAISGGTLSEPLEVIRYKQSLLGYHKQVLGGGAEKNIKLLSEQLKQIIERENIEKIVVGISEGAMGVESMEFSVNLGKVLNTPIETFDETLSTRDAQDLSRVAGINRKKRRDMEDAFAASIMLQNYLDSNTA
ncbi:MAG TPA: RuvX/YqgF family protein [Patescibacteria group bacterium]|nr:RuvX/YqgF family protein [Patescibacteria group bacterium]